MDDGRDASLSSPPASEMSLAVSGPPTSAHMLGHSSLIIWEMYSSVLSLLSYTMHSWSARSCMALMSSSSMSEPMDSISMPSSSMMPFLSPNLAMSSAYLLSRA